MLTSHPGIFKAVCTILLHMYMYTAFMYHLLSCLTVMNASCATAWDFQVGIMLATAWMNPADTIIRREIALACSRLQMDASRYSLTVDHRVQGLLHSSLAAVMPTRSADLQPTTTKRVAQLST